MVITICTKQLLDDHFSFWTQRVHNLTFRSGQEFATVIGYTTVVLLFWTSIAKVVQVLSDLLHCQAYLPLLWCNFLFGGKPMQS